MIPDKQQGDHDDADQQLKYAFTVFECVTHPSHAVVPSDTPFTVLHQTACE